MLVLEATTCLGGMATSALVSKWAPFTDKEKVIDMKKYFSLFLALCLVLTLAACGGSTAAEPTDAPTDGTGQLLVGYSRVDITPKDNVAMSIYGSESERISNGYLDRLYGYALAVTGTNGETVLILICDHSWFYSGIASVMRQQLAKEFGLKEENIVCTGTHNHSAPSLSSTDSATKRYADTFTEQMLQAAREAMADRKPATMYAGSANAERLNFVRRYVLKDGTYPNFEMVDSDLIADHESEPDTQLQVLKFVREGGRDIAVYNWQAHVNMNMQTKANYHLLTSDIFGPFRDEIEKQLDVDCFIWNGAAGNLNPTSQIDGEQLTNDHREYGKLLAQYGVEAYNSATALPAGKVELATTEYVGTVNHTFDNVVAQARQVYAYYKSTGDSKGAREMGAPYGINTERHANRIISNASLPDTQNIYLKAFCIGDVGFICLRYEMFDTNGVQIKTDSPFKQTFIIGYNEEGQGYIPSSLVEDHGGYEVDNNIFVMGTGELLASEYIKLLESIHD